MSARYCSVANCDRPHAAHDLCATHLRRIQRHGDVERGRAARTHGHSGYRGGCRCDTCREGARARERQTRERRRNAAPPEGVHGTRRGYDYWSCRCEKCHAASVPRRLAELKNVNAATRETATRFGRAWTGVELAIADRRDLTAEEAAVLTGRTLSAVLLQRHRIRVRDPRTIALLGHEPSPAIHRSTRPRHYPHLAA